MKFPKDLSPERLSLLSKEDKEIYYAERAQKSDIQNVFESNIFSDEDADVITEEFDSEAFVTSIIDEEMDSLYNEVICEMFSEEEFKDIKSQWLSYIKENSNTESEMITEGAEGQDPYAWIRGLRIGWLGSLAAAGLGLLGSGIYMLLVAGKDKLAMEKLKYYMNRLVELTDQGVHKKRPWYSFLVPKKKSRNNMGEYNTGCFRTIQETADRNMTNSVMQAAHKLGYFANGSMMDISNSDAPQTGSGLDAFRTKVIPKINFVE